MNFTYLKSLDIPTGLFEACREAELFAKSFPMASLSSARRAGEFMVKLVYGTLADERGIYGKTTFDMLSEMEHGYLINDKKWFDSAHRVRKGGNDASHKGKGDVQKALSVLEDLYYEIGFALKLLKLIEFCKPFDISLVPDTTDEPIPKSEIEIELTKEFLNKLRASTPKDNAEHVNLPIDLHVSKIKDSGANSKTALIDAAQYISNHRPNWTVRYDQGQGTVLISCNTGKTLTLAVKSGCPPLGKRVNGVMELLPGIDYVAYSPSFSIDLSYSEQLRIISKEDFLSMWDELGLIRTKVSTALYKRLQKELPPGTQINKEEYADTIAVQSFSNSGKKTKLLNEELQKKPLLSKDGLQVLDSALK